jgi:hypothetical protein
MNEMRKLINITEGIFDRFKKKDQPADGASNSLEDEPMDEFTYGGFGDLGTWWSIHGDEVEDWYYDLDQILQRINQEAADKKFTIGWYGGTEETRSPKTDKEFMQLVQAAKKLPNANNIEFEKQITHGQGELDLPDTRADYRPGEPDEIDRMRKLAGMPPVGHRDQ